MENILNSKRKVVVVCGAGISTASGVPDFKTLYRRDPTLIKALDVHHYKRHTKTLAKFLCEFVSDLHPTEAHLFLKRLHAAGRLLRCYTMNIDGIESRVLPQRLVRYVHGRMNDEARCGRKRFTAVKLLELARSGRIETYNKEHNCRARPGFVMYGEAARHIQELEDDLHRADLVVCMGTRLQVEPVASLVRRYKGKTVCINQEKVTDLVTVIGNCDAVCKGLLLSAGGV